MTTIRYSDAEHTRGIITLSDGREVGTVLPPVDGEMRAAYDAALAAGVKVTAFAGLPPIPIRVAKGDIWRRTTDAEAALIDASLQAQPLRRRNLFRDADYLSSDDELWPELYAGFVVAFGPTRAAQILAPSI